MKRVSIFLVAIICSLAQIAATQDAVKTLLAFNGTESEGNLIFDSAGNLYGTTGDQYDPSLITVFELSPNSDGTWTENVLWTSTGGNEPLNIRAGVVFDISGNLYGTSQYGGASNCGTISSSLTTQTDRGQKTTCTISTVPTGIGLLPVWFLISPAISTALPPLAARITPACFFNSRRTRMARGTTTSCTPSPRERRR